MVKRFAEKVGEEEHDSGIDKVVKGVVDGLFGGGTWTSFSFGVSVVDVSWGLRPNWQGMVEIRENVKEVLF